jgi:hypothetical protein
MAIVILRVTLALGVPYYLFAKDVFPVNYSGNLSVTCTCIKSYAATVEMTAERRPFLTRRRDFLREGDFYSEFSFIYLFHYVYVKRALSIRRIYPFYVFTQIRWSANDNLISAPLP